MSYLIDSYAMLPLPETVEGLAGFSIEAGGILINRKFAGIVSIEFSNDASLKIGKVVIGTSEIRMLQTAVLVAGLVAMRGSAASVFGQTATLKRLKKLTGSGDVTFSQTGTIRVGRKMQGVASVTLSEVGLLERLIKLSGTSVISFSEAGTLQSKQKIAGTANSTLGQAATLQSKQKIAGTAGMTFGQTATLIAPVPSPIARWSLNALVGGSWLDSVGVDDITPADAEVVQGAGFVGAGSMQILSNGNTSYSSARAVLGVLPTTGAISFWTFCNTVSGSFSGAEISFLEPNDSPFLSFILNSSNALLIAGKDGGTAGSSIFSGSGNQWNFVVLTWSGGTSELFVNNVSRGTDNCSMGGSSSVELMTQFVNSGNFDLSNRFDEISVWNVSLNASRRTWLYNSGANTAFPYTF